MPKRIRKIARKVRTKILKIITLTAGGALILATVLSIAGKYDWIITGFIGVALLTAGTFINS